MDGERQPDFLARADRLIQQSRFDFAEQELRHAIDRDPENAIAFAMLGVCLANQDKKEGAIDCTDRAVALSPNEAYVFFCTGLCTESSGPQIRGILFRRSSTPVGAGPTSILVFEGMDFDDAGAME